MLSDARVGKMFSDPKAGKMLSDPRVGKMLSDARVGKMLSDPKVGKICLTLGLENKGPMFDKFSPTLGLAKCIPGVSLFCLHKRVNILKYPTGMTKMWQVPTKKIVFTLKKKKRQFFVYPTTK